MTLNKRGLVMIFQILLLIPLLFLMTKCSTVFTKETKISCNNIYDPLTWGRLSPQQIRSELTQECFTFYLKNRNLLPAADPQNDGNDDKGAFNDLCMNYDFKEDHTMSASSQIYSEEHDIVKLVWNNIDISWLSRCILPSSTGLEAPKLQRSSSVGEKINFSTKPIYRCLSGRERSCLSKEQWKIVLGTHFQLHPGIFLHDTTPQIYPNFQFSPLPFSSQIDSDLILNFISSFSGRSFEVDFIMGAKIPYGEIKTLSGIPIRGKLDLIYLLPPNTSHSILLSLIDSIDKTEKFVRKSNILPLLDIGMSNLSFTDFATVAKNPKLILLFGIDAILDFIHGEHEVNSEFLNAKIYCTNASKFTFEMVHYLLNYSEDRNVIMQSLTNVLHSIPISALGAISGEFVGMNCIDVTKLPLSKISYLHSTAFAFVTKGDLVSWPGLAHIICNACEGVLSLSQIFHISSMVKDPFSRLSIHHEKFNSIAFHHFRYHNSRNDYVYAPSHFSPSPDDEELSVVIGSGNGALIMDRVDFDWKFVQETPKIPARFVNNAAEVLAIPEFFRNIDLHRLLFRADPSEQRYLEHLVYGVSFNLPFVRAMCICEKNPDRIYRSMINDIRDSALFDTEEYDPSPNVLYNDVTLSTEFKTKEALELYEKDGSLSFAITTDLKSVLDCSGDMYNRNELLKSKTFLFTDDHLEKVGRCNGKLYKAGDNGDVLQFPWTSVKHHVMYDLIFSASPLQVEGWGRKEFSKIPSPVMHQLSPESLLCFSVKNLPYISDSILTELSLEQLKFIGAGGNLCWADPLEREREIEFDPLCLKRGRCNELFIINREMNLLKEILRRMCEFSNTITDPKYARYVHFYLRFKKDVIKRRIDALEKTVLVIDERKKLLYCRDNKGVNNFITLEYDYGNGAWIDFVNFLFAFIIVMQLLSFISWISGPSSMEVFNNFPFFLRRRKGRRNDKNKKKIGSGKMFLLEE